MTSAASPSRAALRIGALMTGFALACLGTLALTQVLLETAETSAGNVGLAVMKPLASNLDVIRVAKRANRVAYLGDSTVIAYPVEHQLPKRLQEAVRRRAGGRPPISVIPLAAMGLTPFDFYFLSDAIIDVSPDQIVIPFNPAAFSEPWRSRFPRGELSSWLHPSQLVSALAQPLHYIGLTADRVLLYQVLWRALGFDLWSRVREEQVRLDKARLDLEVWASSWQSPNPVAAFRRRYWTGSGMELQIPKQKRYNERGMRMHHGDAFAGQDASHPVFRVFAAALARFEEAGIPVLVYVVPINVEHSRKLGVLDEEGLKATLETASDITRAHAAAFLDLHDLLPDSGFSDAPGHFSYRGGIDPGGIKEDGTGEEGIDGPRRVADALAPMIVEQARAQARAQSKGPR